MILLANLVLLLNLFQSLLWIPSVAIWRTMSLIIRHWGPFMQFFLLGIIKVKSSHQCDSLLWPFASMTTSRSTFWSRGIILTRCCWPSDIIQRGATWIILVSFLALSNVTRTIAACNLLSRISSNVQRHWRVTIVRSWVHRNTCTPLEMPLLLILNFLRQSSHIEGGLASNSITSSKRMRIYIPCMNNNTWIRADRRC